MKLIKNSVTDPSAVSVTYIACVCVRHIVCDIDVTHLYSCDSGVTNECHGRRRMALGPEWVASSRFTSGARCNKSVHSPSEENKRHGLRSDSLCRTGENQWSKSDV